MPCYVTMLLEDAALESKDQTVDEQRDFDIRWTANSLYAGEPGQLRGSITRANCCYSARYSEL